MVGGYRAQGPKTKFLTASSRTLSVDALYYRREMAEVQVLFGVVA